MAINTVSQDNAKNTSGAGRLGVVVKFSTQAFDEFSSDMCDVHESAHRAKVLCDVMLLAMQDVMASDTKSVFQLMDQVNALTLAIGELSETAALGAMAGQDKAAAWKRRIELEAEAV